jgi:hypothetical protein
MLLAVPRNAARRGGEVRVGGHHEGIRAPRRISEDSADEYWLAPCALCSKVQTFVAGIVLI